jgi:hypothetical protein
MKFIIWGHKLHESTHSYIHNANKKALDFLGYETYWIDHRDDTSSIDFSDAVFIVEHSRSYGMPFIKECKYVQTSFNDEFNENEIPEKNVIRFRHHCDIIDPETFEHKDVETIGELSYWDNKSRILYQAWATDLLPFEIDIENPIKFNKSSKRLNYVAMLCEKELWWWAEEFSTKISNNHGVEFKLYTQSIPDEENKNLIQKSFLCPDFRNDWHLRCGYIPCRVFKNISYGRICGTNSPFIKQYFRDYVVFGGTPQTLYENLLDAEMNQKVNMKEAMLYIKQNHTYINRVQNIIKLLEEN